MTILAVPGLLRDLQSGAMISVSLCLHPQIIHAELSVDCRQTFRVRFAPMANESAADYERRHQWLCDWIGPREGWKKRGPMDVAFTLEALGCSPDGFARVLSLVDQLEPGYQPAGLSDVAHGYRIGIVADPSRTSGEPLGVYLGAVVVAWTISLAPTAIPRNV